jgi:hypothetical protein
MIAVKLISSSVHSRITKIDEVNPEVERMADKYHKYKK